MTTTPSDGSKRIALPLRQERAAAPLAPTNANEMAARGWDAVDIVFVTGDAYVDHPSFAMAILHRVLEHAGFRVAILSQPDWRSCEPWRQFGRPRLFFAISAGNMDSLINHYTANKKVRNDDAYSPGGRIGLRPDRATLPYCQRAREAFPGVPVIAGGVEASLRRLAHYDYWSDSVRRSIVLDSKADLIVYGMGEKVIVEIAQKLHAGASVRDLRGLRGVTYALGAKESQVLLEQGLHTLGWEKVERLPSYEEVRDDKWAFAEATRIIHTNTNPFNAAALVQFHDRQAVVQTPPAFPLTQQEMDAVYDLPYTRRPHPGYTEPIPAYEMIKDSVTILRGCFGGCTFCSITAHQGRIIQSRSKESILKEVQQLAADPHFKGIVSDIGGATANMYAMRCSRPEVEAKCKRLSCVHPTICKLLSTDHGPLLALMREVRTVKGVRKVLVSSGIRMDLAQLSPEYIQELAEHHTGGRLKVAPEHTSPQVLELMKKPSIENFGTFARQFRAASAAAGKPQQQIVPYFIASHPGSDLHAMIDLALYLKRNGYRPDQVQDFIPAPFDIATCMYYTGIDPFSKKPVPTAKNLRDRKLQRALMQFFKPENYFAVREALLRAGRADLIGGCDGLIPAHPPREALEARRQRANRTLSADHYHAVPPVATEPPRPAGYRPGRTTHQRRNKPGRKHPPQ
ncbi:MAG: YgiQ family radical SAM protein [Gemmataceae bacterium]|nr:YgiQ family radical SAM protein [Gemmata sp.]MDW8196769.1 YgiQ family radical SAM protein [Gemmataceae bacterium]